MLPILAVRAVRHAADVLRLCRLRRELVLRLLLIRRKFSGLIETMVRRVVRFGVCFCCVCEHVLIRKCQQRKSVPTVFVVALRSGTVIPWVVERIVAVDAMQPIGAPGAAISAPMATAASTASSAGGADEDGESDDSADAHFGPPPTAPPASVVALQPIGLGVTPVPDAAAAAAAAVAPPVGAILPADVEGGTTVTSAAAVGDEFGTAVGTSARALDSELLAAVTSPYIAMGDGTSVKASSAPLDAAFELPGACVGMTSGLLTERECVSARARSRCRNCGSSARGQACVQAERDVSGGRCCCCCCGGGSSHSKCDRVRDGPSRAFASHVGGHCRSAAAGMRTVCARGVGVQTVRGRGTLHCRRRGLLPCWCAAMRSARMDVC